MEKESAEKATTEFEDSVTSEEQGSLAENEEKSIENSTKIESESTSDTNVKQEEASTVEETATEPEEPVEDIPEASEIPAEVPVVEEVVEAVKTEAIEPVEDKPEASEIPAEVPVVEEVVEAVKTEAKEVVEDKPEASEIPAEVPVVEEVVDVVNTEAKEVVEDKPETSEIPAEVPVVEEVVEVVNTEAKEVVEDKPETSEIPIEVPVVEEVVEVVKAETIKPAIEEEKLEEQVEASISEEELPLVEETKAEIETKEETAKEEKPSGEEAKPVEEIKVEEGTSTEVVAEATPEKLEEPEATDGSKEDESKSEEDKQEPVSNQDEFKDVDFTTYSKEELVEVIKKLGKDENPFKADKVLQQIAPLFNKMRADDREITLKEFIKDGGVEDDFQYRTDELSLRFDANYKLIKDKKSKKFREQGNERVKNLEIAEEVLKELRDFMDSEESTTSFNQFKKIQEKWRAIGDVPTQNSKTLWANYNALVHRFYDQRSIYFELKELDRRKNYESKLVLVDKAAALEDEKDLRVAIKILNDLHYEYKHLGPVPQELQEELWQKFKAASDKVYEKRKDYVTELKATLHENLLKKQELIEKINTYFEFKSDRIKDWNEKTKEVIQLQKTWDTIGGLPKEKAKQINKEFWSAFKKFFSHKHEFFKKLDSERDSNLIKKQALLEKAEQLKDSDDWEETANEYKKLQNEWREIGPVPEKMRNKIYLKFKAACDHFFDKRREGHKTSQDSYKENLTKKKEIIEKINGFKAEADKNLEEFNIVRKQFLEIGFVPKKNISSVKESFQEAVEGFLGAVTSLNDKQKTEISLEAEFSNLAGSEHSERDLYQKEQAVRRHVNKLEDDIALWRNNLEFFANSKSKSTDKLRNDVNEKIDSAAAQLDGLKRQLKMLRSL